MVLVIHGASNWRGDPLCRQMHAVRKAVFVDRLGWNIPIIDGAFEIDQYDGEDTTYLVVADSGSGDHLASVRLLPSTGPHILGDLFPGLCEGPTPRGQAIWEISRLCSTPGLSRAQEMRARHKLSAALIEYALLNGIERYNCVLNVRWLSTLLMPGWPCDPLGPPCAIDGELMGAFAISISSRTLHDFRGRWGGRFPVLEFKQLAA